MPPPNITPETAIVIPSLLPYITTQTGIHEAGTTYTVWYKWTPFVETILMGVMFRGDGVIYKPDCRILMNDSLDFIGYITGNLFDQVPLIAGKTYYFEVIPNGNPTPATLNISLLRAPDKVPVPKDSIFIRGATINFSWLPLGYKGLGAGYINPNTGEIFNWKPMFGVGESGDFLPSGTIIFGDDANAVTGLDGQFFLLNSDMSVRTQFTWAWTFQTGDPLTRASREYGRFYLGSKGYSGNGTFASWASVDENGNLSPTVFLPDRGMNALANSVDDQFVYITGNGAGVNFAKATAIRRWNKALGIWGPDLVPENTIPGYDVSDMLVMPNGHVVAVWQKTSGPGDCILKIYDTAGVTLKTFIPTPNNNTSVNPRLGYADDLTSFWLFIHFYNNPGQTSDSYFFNLLESDASILKTIHSPDAYYTEFDHGPNPQYRFATSDSCPFILIIPPIIPPPPINNPLSGIYKVIPNSFKSNDTVYLSLEPEETEDRAIPRPTWKTGLVGG